MKRTFSMLALAVLTIGLLGSCTRIDNLEKRVDTLENDKIATIDSQIASIQSSIKKLDQIDALSKRADELEAFVNNELASKDWVYETCATLEQYQVTCDTVANLKVKLGQTDEKIDECVESLKDWITSEFNDYYKAAEIDAKLKALKDTTFADAISATKEELTTGYKAAIKAAIEDNDGFVTPEIKESIASTNDKVAALAASVDSLDEELALVNKMVQSIDFVPMDADGRSLAVANYVNDLDTASLFLDLNLRYRVKPAAALDSILAAYADDAAEICLYYKGIRTSDTRAGESGPDCLKIKSVIGNINEDGLIVVTVDGDEFNRLPVRNCISNHSTISVALGMKYGNSDIISEYTDVDFEELNFDKEMEEVYRQMAILIGSKQQGKDYNAYRVLFNMCGDDVLAAGRRFGDHDEIAALNQFRYTAHNPVIYECYTNFYKAIDACNQFICKYFDPKKDYKIFDSRVPDGSWAPSRRCLAEARVLRAWLHFTLATGWGNPPIVTEWPAPAKPANSGSKEDVFKWCIEELKICIDSNALRYKDGTNDTKAICVVSKQFAQALAGKVAMFNNEHQIARNYLSAVIESGVYTLQPGEQWESNFHNNFFFPANPGNITLGNGNPEKIFELNLEKYAGYGYVEDFLFPYMGMETDLWKWYSDGFISDPMAGNLSIKGKGCVGFPFAFAQEYLENDGNGPRRRGTFLTPEEALVEGYYTDYNIELGETRTDRLNNPLIGIKKTGLYGQSGYLPVKMMARDRYSDIRNGNNVVNFTVMRYAEALLLYAEACIESSDEAKGKAALNYVQTRGQVPTTELTRENVVKEKKYELWMEGCRWTDLVRWSKNGDVNMEELLGKAGVDVPVLYDSKTRECLPGENPTKIEGFDNRLYTIPTNYAKERGFDVGFKKGKHELFPFPADVLSSNHNLKQNQGW